MLLLQMLSRTLYKLLFCKILLEDLAVSEKKLVSYGVKR